MVRPRDQVRKLANVWRELSLFVPLWCAPGLYGDAMNRHQGVTLVTGATGTVGRYVVDALAEAGLPLRRAVTHPDPDAELDEVSFDFSDRSTWEPALADVDRVFLMRPPAISDIKGVIRPFIQEMARRPIASAVVLSLMGVNPAMPHWQLEKDVKASGMPWTMLRPAFFMQNLETAYRADIRDHDRIRLPAGRGRTSFVDTRDIAAVAALALIEPAAHAGKAYTLTGAEALGWDAVASILSAELGRAVHYEPIGLLAARREMKEDDLPSAYVNVQLLISVVARLGLADTMTADVSALLSRPPRRLVDYIRDRRELWLTT